MLPKKLRHKYDTVFIDPPYTINGIRVVLQRALEALKLEENKKIYLCYSTMDLSNSSLIELQKHFLRKGLLIKEILPKFNSYRETKPMKDELKMVGYSPKRNWFVSSLIRLSTTNLQKKERLLNTGYYNIYKYEKKK